MSSAWLLLPYDKMWSFLITFGYGNFSFFHINTRRSLVSINTFYINKSNLGWSWWKDFYIIYINCIVIIDNSMAFSEKDHTWADEDCLILTQQQIEQNKKVSEWRLHTYWGPYYCYYSFSKIQCNSIDFPCFRHLQHGSIPIWGRQELKSKISRKTFAMDWN